MRRRCRRAVPRQVASHFQEGYYQQQQPTEEGQRIEGSTLDSGRGFISQDLDAEMLRRTLSLPDIALQKFKRSSIISLGQFDDLLAFRRAGVVKIEINDLGHSYTQIWSRYIPDESKRDDAPCE